MSVEEKMKVFDIVSDILAKTDPNVDDVGTLARLYFAEESRSRYLEVELKKAQVYK